MAKKKSTRAEWDAQRKEMLDHADNLRRLAEKAQAELDRRKQAS